MAFTETLHYSLSNCRNDFIFIAIGIHQLSHHFNHLIPNECLVLLHISPPNSLIKKPTSFLMCCIMLTSDGELFELKAEEC
jgi:hypothetical protein